MVDGPNRKEPRFPGSKVAIVSQKVAEQLDRLQVGPSDLSISGAARGGDLIFAEHCYNRGAEVWLFLPRPEEEFLDESVRLPDGQWEERFHKLCCQPGVRRFFQHEHLGEVSDGLDVHGRNNLWVLSTARALAPSPDHIYALVVWDEKSTGDGPGGTSDFVSRVAQSGGHVEPPINPTKLMAQ